MINKDHESQLKNAILCKHNVNYHHLLKNAMILKCGHSYCKTCILNDIRLNGSIVCAICSISFEIKNIDELIPNRFVDKLIKLVYNHKQIVEELHEYSINYSLTIKSI